jgi:hypothetical protein
MGYRLGKRSMAVRPTADMALLGCSAFILNDDAITHLNQARQKASLINLTQVPWVEWADCITLDIAIISK